MDSDIEKIERLIAAYATESKVNIDLFHKKYSTIHKLLEGLKNKSYARGYQACLNDKAKGSTASK